MLFGYDIPQHHGQPSSIGGRLWLLSALPLEAHHTEQNSLLAVSRLLFTCWPCSSGRPTSRRVAVGGGRPIAMSRG